MHIVNMSVSFLKFHLNGQFIWIKLNLNQQQFQVYPELIILINFHSKLIHKDIVKDYLIYFLFNI
jgi:hypothetical protein